MNKIIYLASKFHGFNILIDHCIEVFIKILMLSNSSWIKYRQTYSKSFSNFEASQKFIDDPRRFLTSMAIVLKSPTRTDKGTIVIAYNYAFPTFALLFNLDEVLKKYHIVLEPSTARFFMPDILMFKGLTEKIYIQTGEPRDEKLLRRFVKNAHPVPIAANWWVDSRIFKPDSTVKKDIDIIMVSSWLKLKRHYLLFKALKKLKKQGKILKCVLVGYPIDMKKADIVALAKEYGVLQQIEFHEWLNQTEIALLYQRAKLNLLLSTREGFNRSIIEGLHANVPCLIREGFNFGHKYNYINRKTGGYYTDKNLHTCISDTLNKIEQFSPNEWIIQNKMTAQDAAGILEKEIYNTRNNKLAVKVSGLDGMEYWNTEDNEKYSADYKDLLTNLKR